MRCEQCFEPLPTQQNVAQGGNPNTNPMGQPPQGDQYQQNASGYQQNNTPFPANQSNPGYQNPFAQNGPPCPKDYLVLNIVFGILAMCSCIGVVPLIIGIVFSARVKSKYNMGDYAGAASASNVAKIMFIVNLVFAILAVAYWIFSFVLAFTGYGTFMLEEILDSYYMVALKLF